MIDLFTKPTMKERVTDFCKHKHYITSIDLENFKDSLRQKEGNIKGILRVHRTARDLVKAGILRRMDNKEKALRGFNKRFACYEYIYVRATL